MNKYLQEDSTLVQQGNTYATISWVLGDIVYGVSHSLVGGLFLVSNAIGIAAGQKPMGAILQQSIAGAAGVAIACAATQDLDTAVMAGKIFAGSGAFLACTNAAASVAHENYDTNKDQRNLLQRVTDPIIGLPNKALCFAAEKAANSSSPLLRCFSENVLEVTQRPMFAANLFLMLTNCGMLVSAIGKTLSHNYMEALQEFTTTAAWITGNFLSGISTQAEDRENIFLTVGKKAWCALTR